MMPRVNRVRLAESIASILREQIISGELTNGDRLPSLELMSAEYGVGPPAIREALRILENDGLVTVLRGNVGGALVHTPTPEVVSYALSLFMRSSQVPLTDVLDAWAALETLCAAACARRSDRADHVVPVLRRSHEAGHAALNGPGTLFEAAMRQFHLALAESCGNRTLSLLNGIMSRLWNAQEETWSRQADSTSNWPPLELRLRGLEYHAQIVNAIDRGDAEKAAALMRELASHPMHYGPFVGPTPLQGRDGQFTGRLHSAKPERDTTQASNRLQ
jgi:GntR family transcriptional repressor for pyruvate dehydrogenase complex